MNTAYMKREITDYENFGCTDDEIKLLLFWFGELMSSIAGTVAYCAWYNLADLALVKHSPNHQIVGNFSLEIWRVYEQEKLIWSRGLTRKKLVSLTITSTRLDPRINKTKADQFLGDKCVGNFYEW